MIDHQVAPLHSMHKQRATFSPENATSSATPAQPIGLKAAALKVLGRNSERNTSATAVNEVCNKRVDHVPNIVASDSLEYQSIAWNRLATLANESDHSLDDLLDWYKDDMDMRDIARWDMNTVRHVVGQYISDPGFYRGNI